MDEFNPGIIINLNSNYSDFRFDPFTLPVFVAFIPFLYIIPTCFIILRIIQVYIEKGIKKNEEVVNKSVFLVIILCQLSCLSFFLGDLLTIRLPSTGIMTSWCYKQTPNRLLTLLFTFQIYSSYPVMIYPVLLNIVRFVPIHWPLNHRKINSKILRYSIPFIHLYPFFFTFFMFPAVGVCRQLKDPYDFGSIYVHFFGSWNDLRNAPFQLLNSFIWFIICLLSSFLLYRKLRNLKVARCQLNRSVKYQTAEVSLTLTATSMVLAYITNLVFLGNFIIDIRLGTYFAVFRPYGNDLEICVVTWVFYLTHPAFHEKKKLRNNHSTPHLL
ncbi:hypothetical protein GCK72_014313 [Caenorhabditis remanei]|uniref:Serpentine Receptor, class U n=1 Tax=Caenorhabditis remanei TaxID=31234 RepID=A0A6A5GTD6_CAERE|nr:hypothetical protein GCK72_014313 [Caenorhabditis remanei]KAF1757856.1 hypothetical protein GCK72_014313 [Caenorhabditis remanei]